MAVIRCAGGHYYDDEKFSRCPHCGIFSNLELNNEPRQKLENDERTVAMKPESIEEYTVALKNMGNIVSDDQKTIGLYSAEKGNDYVTGWLVCINGEEKGRDYRLHRGFNYVGRGLDMSVSIVDDLSISRQKHCAIVYDDLGNAFSLVPTAGNTVYLNGELIMLPAQLKTGDLIQIGNSEFEFIAFCREGRVWGKE